jgi:undecaprenyl-diphosphatase
MAQSVAETRLTAERKSALCAFRSLAVTGTALAVFGWLAGEVLAAGTQRFDLSVRNSIHQYASPIATQWMLRITRLGNWYIILSAALVLLAFFLLKRRPREARLLAITMLGALLLDGILKLTFQRPRPEPFFGLPVPNTYSFPSGHALVTLCFVGFLAGVLTLSMKRPWMRWMVWALAAVVVGMVGLSRVYLGVHYPSDVLAGYAAAVAWMSAVGAVAHREERIREEMADEAS